MKFIIYRLVLFTEIWYNDNVAGNTHSRGSEVRHFISYTYLTLVCNRYR